MIDLKGHLLRNRMSMLPLGCPFKIMNGFQLGRTNDGANMFLLATGFPTGSGPHIINQISSYNNMLKKMCIETVGFGH